MACINVAIDTEVGLGDYPVHQKILIEGNTVRHTPGLAVLISSASDVTIKNNRIIDANSEPWNDTGASINARAKGSIMVTRSSHIRIGRNSISSTAKTYDIGIHVDPENTSDVAMEIE